MTKPDLIFKLEHGFEPWNMVEASAQSLPGQSMHPEQIRSTRSQVIRCWSCRKLPSRVSDENLALPRQSQVDLCEFKASLVYRVSSMPAGDIYIDAVSKRPKRKKRFWHIIHGWIYLRSVNDCG